MGQKYAYRYVNYELMLEDLKKGIEPEKSSKILVKRKNILSDPVIDPRESWKSWFLRNL